MVYPALLPLMRTPRLPVVDWTDGPHRFKWTRPFRRKTKCGFCACAITFETHFVFLKLGKTFDSNQNSHLFYISLTAHLGLIRVNNQLDALFQCIYFTSVHVSSNPVLIIRRINCNNTSSGITVCRWLVCRSDLHTSHLHTVIRTRWCIDTIDSPNDEHWVARNK
jgi:hypothetical protein